MILILGGTTEGRMAASVLEEAGKIFYYSTKGNDLHLDQHLELSHGLHLQGSMDSKQMLSFCREHHIQLLVDAAHPFAENLRQTVLSVARQLQLPVIRYERIYPLRHPDIIWCDNFDVAIQKMESLQVENLLALTGVQTIERLKPFWSKHTTTFRILQRQSSIQLAYQCGFPSERLVFYQGAEHEQELFLQLNPDAILTKESGLSGGFNEKVAAAFQLGIKVFAIKRPDTPIEFISVNGPFGLRKEIERLLPTFFPLRSGFTTGACATAASKAALLALLTGEKAKEISFRIPDGETLKMPIDAVVLEGSQATATVTKQAGDDPDVTNGMKILSTVAFREEDGIQILGGQGIGRVTLPGLGLPVGHAAINPMPQRMIRENLSELTSRGLIVTLSIPQGEQLAQKTFNPRLGIEGGLSVIGTSGIVRPFSHEAFIQTIRRELQVCQASGAKRLVINSGARSERIVRAAYPDLPMQAFVHYGNAIGETLTIADEMNVQFVTMGLMIGKGVKLAEGHLDTHSHTATVNRPFLCEVADSCGCSQETQRVISNMNLARQLWDDIPLPQQELLMPALLKRCQTVCRQVFHGKELEILLISEDGRIAYSIR